MSHGADDDPARTAGRGRLGSAYRRLWVSSTASNLADGFFQVALPLVAIRFTREPARISGLTVALTLPWLLVVLQAGALADRADRRRLMVGANLARAAVVAGSVAVLALDAGSIWLLYLVAFAVGVTETVYDTTAQSIIPQVVTREQLARANGRLFGAQVTANEFVGPPLGGLLVAAGSLWAFTAPTGLWVVAAGVLLVLPGTYRIERPEPTTMRTDIAEGVRYLLHHPILRTLAAMTGAFNLASNAIFAIFVLYAVGPTSAMQLSEPGYGILLSMLAAGSLVGSLVADRVEARLGRARSLVAAFGLASTIAFVPAVTTSTLAIGIAFFIGGLAIITVNVITVSLRQLITPGHLLGRVNSGYRLVGWGTRPLGALAGGLVGQALGLRPVFLLAGTIVLASLLGMFRITDTSLTLAADSGGPREP